MKKLNKKGVTLIELIVSFAIVGVAIIYFFQTLYTVKTIYTTSEEETKEYVVKDYGLRLVDEKLIDYKSDLPVINGKKLYLVDYDTNAISPSNCSKSAKECCKDKNKENGVKTSLYKFVNNDGEYSIEKYDVLICY
ncbi:MAG TPA: type II secretion system protein [Candidatus Aphodocola excrementigallinarum]|uniref:Type II secretion system protein n=1 Tax=Candidatus Aphodocola excrementigallinarum TaxID=2840670 RepID=A0A9D1IM21_9FIRM|nr:type II secretion system protein [Candidatus Aphodocola excrementigallinarum]